MSIQAKQNSLISICSLNVNHSNAATHAAMYIIAESKEPSFDLFLVQVQEPWWEKINEEYRTVSFSGWQTILLKWPILAAERPRVVAYYKTGTNLEITLHNDIIMDLDIMAIEIKRDSDITEAMRIINIYNQKQLSDHIPMTYTSDCIANLQWDPHVPTVITGNWNICHPQWDDGVNVACPRTCKTLQWLEGNGFTLCNEPFVPTREDLMGHALVINLMLKTLQWMEATY